MATSRAIARANDRAAQRAAQRGFDCSTAALQQTIADMAGKIFLKPLAPMTAAGHRRLIKAFTSFLEECNIDPQLYLAPKTAQPVPDATWLTFMKWFAMRGAGNVRSSGVQLAQEGQASDPLSCKTVRGVFESLVSARHYVTGLRDVTKATRELVNGYIASELKQELSLTTAARDKPTATADDLKAVLLASFVAVKGFRIAEERIAFTLVLKLLVYTVSRIGELITCAGYTTSLLWGSIELFMITLENGEATLMAIVCNNNLKGKKEDDSAFKSHVIWLNKKEPLLCPIMDLLAMAIIQDVLVHDAAKLLAACSSPSTQPAGTKMPIPIKAASKKERVFRRILHKGLGTLVVSPEKAPWQTWFAELLREAGHSAGISARHTSYAYRRLGANALDISDVTEATRRSIMGHNVASKAFGAYAAKLIQLDVQGITLGEGQKLDTLAVALRLRHSFALPTSISAAGRRMVLDCDEVKHYTVQMEEARARFRARYPSMSFKDGRDILDADALAIALMQSDRDHRARTLMRGVYEQELKDFAKNGHSDIMDGIAGRSDIVDELFNGTVEGAMLQEGTDKGGAKDAVEALKSLADVDLGDLEAAGHELEARLPESDIINAIVEHAEEFGDGPLAAGEDELASPETSNNLFEQHPELGDTGNSTAELDIDSNSFEQHQENGISPADISFDSYFMEQNHEIGVSSAELNFDSHHIEQHQDVSFDSHHIEQHQDVSFDSHHIEQHQDISFDSHHIEQHQDISVSSAELSFDSTLFEQHQDISTSTADTSFDSCHIVQQDSTQADPGQGLNDASMTAASTSAGVNSVEDLPSVQAASRRNEMVRALLGQESPLSATDLLACLIDSQMLLTPPFRQMTAEAHPANGCSICSEADIPARKLQAHRRKCELAKHLDDFLANNAIMIKMRSLTECPCPPASGGIGHCRKVKANDPLAWAKHLWSKFSHAGVHCKFPGCDFIVADGVALLELRVHLQNEHQLLTATSSQPTTIRKVVELQTFYCHDCQLYITTAASWREHCRLHIEALLLQDAIDYAPVLSGGFVVKEAICPICFHNGNLKPEAALCCFPEWSQLGAHMQRHLAELFKRLAQEDDAGQANLLVCPIPACKAHCADVKTFGNHFVDAHGLCIFGCEGKKGPFNHWDGDIKSLVAIQQEAKKRAHRVEAKREGTPRDNSRALANAKKLRLQDTNEEVEQQDSDAEWQE